MARKSARKRAEERRQKQKQQRQRLIFGAAGILIVGAVLFMVFRPRPVTVSQERLEMDPVYGNPNAEVTLVEYASYGCPACRALHESGLLEQMVEEYEGQVNLVFRDFPYISPNYDQMASEVAQCVLDQSEDAFWEFHHLLYTDYFMNQDREGLIELAGTLGGVDAQPLTACAQNRVHQQTVEYDGERGRSLGLRGSPSVFVGDQRIFSPSEENIRAAIEASLSS